MNIEGWVVEFKDNQSLAQARDLLGKALAQQGKLVDLVDGPEPLNEAGTVWALAPTRAAALLSEAEAWDLAYKMQDSVAILFVEPIVPVPGMADDVNAPPEPKPFGSFGNTTDLDESGANEWAIEKMNVRAGWATLARHRPDELPGKGVIVAHPDTGFTDHPELITGLVLDLALARNFKDRRQVLPIDPLTGRSPGHGTATASVMTSSESTQLHPGVVGVAPGVSLVPLRVHDSVIHFSWGNLAKALYHAADSGCHVMSMSLGGAWAGNTLRRAIEYAAARGVILISAAGNHTGFVVYPARYRQALAIAASNARDGLWSGSALGTRVVVTAPGESVWRGKVDMARDGQPEFTVERSSGTSYATALTAGACALWLHRHDRNKLLQRYGTGGLAAAFRSALQGSVRKVPGWPRKKAGPGIVNVDGLIQAKLPDAVAPASLSTTEAHPSIEAIAMLNNSTEAQARKWARDTLGLPDDQLNAKLDVVGAELSLNLMRNRLNRSPAPPPLPMSAQPRDGLSKRLRAAAPGL